MLPCVLPPARPSRGRGSVALCGRRVEQAGQTAASLKLSGRESFDILGMETLTHAGEVTVRATFAEGVVNDFTAVVRIDTPEELVAYRHGGILPYVLRQLVRS